jgi:hypothetical protein
MSFRRFSLRRSIAGAPGLGWVLPAVALAIGAFTWRRHFTPLPPMPRLPVRRKPPRPSTTARADLARSSAPAPQVVVPDWFWDVGAIDEDEQDDPAEIPYPGLPLVSEASQSAALLDPADREASSVVLHW